MALKPGVQTHLHSTPQCRASVSPLALPHTLGTGDGFLPQWPDPAARKEEGAEAGAKVPCVTGVSHGDLQPPLRSRARNWGFESLWALAKEGASTLGWHPPPRGSGEGLSLTETSPPHQNPAWELS